MRRNPLSGVAEVPVGGAPGVVPGLVLSGIVAAAAWGVQGLPGLSGLSPMLLAVLLGVLLRNTVGVPACGRRGFAFTLRVLLRTGVALLGLRITFGQVAELGGAGVAVVAASVLATFAATCWMGRLLGVAPSLARLIAAGTSICGASAVVAASAAVGARQTDVAYSVAVVTVFGTLAMVLYPWLGGLLPVDDAGYGVWAGASIHEVAQVVAAAFQGGEVAGHAGTVAKLTRVVFLVPVIMGLALVVRREAVPEAGAKTGQKVRLPLFPLAFVGFVVLNSVDAVPAAPRLALIDASGILLSLALAAMGMETDLRGLKAAGLRPALLGAFSTVFIALFSLGAVWWLM